MVSFPDFSNLGNSSDVGSILSLPNGSYPYFWAWILAGLWIIVASTLYFKDKERTGKAKLLSDLAVSSFAIIILSLIGTLVGFVSLSIMVYIVVIGLSIIAIWFFSE